MSRRVSPLDAPSAEASELGEPEVDRLGRDEAEERRRAERVSVNEELAEADMSTYVTDLSEHGLFLHTSRRLSVGSGVQIRFTIVLEDPVVLRAEGRVVRHQAEPSGMGIEFTRLDPATLLRISDVVSRSRPRELGMPLTIEFEASDPVPRHRAPVHADGEPRGDEAGPADAAETEERP